MLNFLYTLIIFPIEQIIELCYVFAFRVSRSPGLSIMGLSVAVSTLVLPLYLMAEKQQQAEREKQKQMKRMGDNIKAVFKGDKRYMMLSTLYRQHNYHPVYALRSSLDLFIQIPFFIAAYHFISNLQLLNGQKFKFISDLGAPDGLLWGINLLPILMTLINIVSGVIYTKKLARRDKIQAYGIAAVFLLLLYNSPSALVLYWTGNNVYNLVKNLITQKAKNPKFVVFTLVSVFCLVTIVYILFFHPGLVIKRFLFAFVLAIIPFIPLLLKVFARMKGTFPISRKISGNIDYTSIFILSMAVLFLLGGFLVPSSLIASSVHDFSFIENYKSPFPFIAHTALQAFGIFLLWPLCIYFILPPQIKGILAKTAAVIAGIAMVNVFLFPGKYGFLSLMFKFSESLYSSYKSNIINLLVIAFIVIILLLLIHNLKRIMVSGLIIIISTLVIASTINSIRIYNEFQYSKLRVEKNKKNAMDYELVYQLSTTGKNILVIMLDRAISSYIPYIFEEKPELYDSFYGFVWYKNTVSFGRHTNFGTPGLFGGYEYTPLEMQVRNNIPLVKKHNEAILLLPKIFQDQGYRVIVTEPPLANYGSPPDLSIFDDYPQMQAENVISKYTEKWLSTNRLDRFEFKIEFDTIGLINSYLIRFSFLKFVPLFLRNYIYDNGSWLTVKQYEAFANFPFKTLENYISLDILSEITEISNQPFNTYNTLRNDLTHEPSFFEPPDYIPSNIITYKGDSPFANEENYHVNMASLLLLGKWFDFLKENNAYDNTKIIIVTDHGIGYNSELPDNFILPNGDSILFYAALLLVKDFESQGILSTNDTFMTNADVPLIALDGIIENPINPWTGKLLTSDKENGIILSTSGLWDVTKHAEYSFNIKPNEWLHVHTNIFDPENWSQVQR